MLRPNDSIGPYVIKKKLGRGGFGEVWLAEKRTPLIVKEVALKLPLDEEPDLEKIRREAEVWKQACGHPNVLPVIEADIFGNQVVIVSEYAAEGSLSDWLKKHGGGAPSVEDAVRIERGILAGLSYLHGFAEPIIHRDLKPSNILLRGGEPCIADFGLARVLKTSNRSTTISGTLPYMAPEAFDGQRTAGTDLWSAAVILYLMLAGRLPSPYEDMTRLIKAICFEPTPPLPGNVPLPLQELLERALRKNPAERFGSAKEFLAALDDAWQVCRTPWRGRVAEATPTEIKVKQGELKMAKEGEWSDLQGVAPALADEGKKTVGGDDTVAAAPQTQESKETIMQTPASAREDVGLDYVALTGISPTGKVVQPAGGTGVREKPPAGQPQGDAPLPQRQAPELARPAAVPHARPVGPQVPAARRKGVRVGVVAGVVAAIALTVLIIGGTITLLLVNRGGAQPEQPASTSQDMGSVNYGHYIDNSDGTVTDTVTGLMWSKTDSRAATGRGMNWDEAKAWVDGLSTGGHRDWRMPTITELNSIYDPSYHVLACDHNANTQLHVCSLFSAGGAYWFWSSEDAGSGRFQAFCFSSSVVFPNYRDEVHDDIGARGVRPAGLIRGTPQPVPVEAGKPNMVADRKVAAAPQTLLGMKFVRIPAGEFLMGATDEEHATLRRNGSWDERFINELPRHRVAISSFEMQTTEVTQAQWKAVMGSNPSGFRGDDLPVEQVSWNDVQEFIRKLNEQDPGKGYRLPSEAEWEYACRAGTTGERYGELDVIAWYYGNSGDTTHSVGQKQPNAWGIYDMMGNVWEWCADWYGSYPSAGVTDPTGPSVGSRRVNRGGSWHRVAGFCRSAFRGRDVPDYRDRYLGFRLVRSLP